MSLNANKNRVLCLGLIICFLSGCFHPPFNNFKPDSRTARTAAGGAAGGAVIGAVASGTVSGTLLGGGIGGAVGAVSGLYKDSKPKIIKDLMKQDIQFIQYGDTKLLIVPTDKYFMFNSPRLNEVCYPGLNNIIRLLKYYPNSRFYVAGFTDNVGSRHHKKQLSQAQAETMLSFLWANNIPASQLKAEGYGDKNAVSDNNLIHGSAQNRRIEIQWVDASIAQPQEMYTK
ncbi:C-OmpA-like family protein CmpA [Legionella worsleiensis]|uniref:Outer membrane protein, OmpA family protein n=1 Tax=Legionella worsleiensis TaxID=45076 RepID=A0A0W1A3F4_9GAMM|nr:C-OmpA-like family protein CmpA [Legionella worsleiensis]KTD75830.1 outer membrane protein, OmpA family protein [Legionella worsleiensis]STY32842.1 outer membrane protein, OmpA family protein [Legionella worsleiensis]